MEKFRLVERPREESAEDEIRVTNQGRVTTYVAYAARLFKDENRNTITFRASGLAIPIAVSTIEILKRRVKGLHQQTNIGITTLTDEYEPLEQGLTKRTLTRQVPYLLAILSKLDAAVDKSAPGYQAPLDESLVKELKEFTSGERPRPMGTRGRGRRGRGRGGFRGGRRGGRRPFGGPGGSLQDQPPLQDSVPVAGGNSRGGSSRRGNGRGRGFTGERPPTQTQAAAPPQAANQE
eukprot:Gregarina_sp_Poly_1__3713@NODE_2099_length_2686_cov_253_893471_g1354_i0_p2_GENE_NODE_2099_length_2686_cov_253_893471_g1354_i0NODE_2099_length_2686_cov_253_893471_g1354_i0_p2_ORF_typecomplete_len235_score26_40Alba/PF01918_21/1_9e19Rpp20/PF12328_8/0_076FoP_duplication/PF13865_6/28FoP_duplication/PF13865_6/2_2_NODE_2099_length_2686_cov_253_893471_g1354_i016982402